MEGRTAAGSLRCKRAGARRFGAAALQSGAPANGGADGTARGDGVRAESCGQETGDCPGEATNAAASTDGTDAKQVASTAASPHPAGAGPGDARRDSRD